MSARRKLWSVAKCFLALGLLIGLAEGYIQLRVLLEQPRLDEWAGKNESDGVRSFTPTLSALGVKEIVRDNDRDGSPESGHIEIMGGSPWVSSFTLLNRLHRPGYDTLHVTAAQFQLDVRLRDNDGDGVVDRSVLDFRQEPGSPRPGDEPGLTGIYYRYTDFDGDRYFDLIEKYQGDDQVDILILTRSELYHVVDGRPEDGTIVERADGNLAKLVWEDGAWHELETYSAEEAQSLLDALEPEDSK